MFISLFWRDRLQWARAFSFTRFPDHTQRRTTVDRIPVDESLTRRRDLYLTTHNNYSRQTSKSPVVFEPTTPAGEQPHTSALDRAVLGTDSVFFYDLKIELSFLESSNILTTSCLYSFTSLLRCRKYNHIMIRIISENVSDVDSSLCIECSPLLKPQFSQIHWSKIKRLFRTMTLGEKYSGTRSDSTTQVCNFFINFPLTPFLEPHIFLSFWLVTFVNFSQSRAN